MLRKHGLDARGRVCDSTGRVNGPGNRVDTAHLAAYDDETKSGTLRVTHSKIPEFWLEVTIPVAVFNSFVEDEEGAEEHPPLAAAGYVCDSTGMANTPANCLDSARLVSCDDGVVTLRVDHSTLPEFWLEVQIPVITFTAVVG